MPAPAPDLDLTKAEAQWIDADTVVWKVKATGSTSQQLVYAPHGGITIKDGALSDEGHWLRLTPASLTDAQKAAYPHLKDAPAFTVDPRDRDRVHSALGGQLIATQRAANGALTAATGVQTPGAPPTAALGVPAVPGAERRPEPSCPPRAPGRNTPGQAPDASAR